MLAINFTKQWKGGIKWVKNQKIGIKKIFRFIQGVLVGSVVTIIIFYGLTYKEHQKTHALLEKHGIEKHKH